MSTPERLMGVGMEAEQAKRVGFFVHATATAGNLTIKGPGNQMINIASAAASLVLSNFDIGDMVIVNSETVAVSVYPASDEFIYPTSAGVAKAVNSNTNRMFVKGFGGIWYVLASV